MTQKTLLLTGASRGIGHATVKLFQAAGWRVLTVSRSAFDARCPWHAGTSDHFQGDLADPAARADLVALNAGAALYVAGLADTISAGVEQARGVMRDASALARLEAYAARSRELAA